MTKLKDASELDTIVESAKPAAHAPGTVLKPFNGPTRRFPKDYVVIDADVPDLPRSIDELKAGGFVA
jgi:hypothetical protein